MHLATIERFVLGSHGVLRGAAISEMEDLQEPKVPSRSSPCWQMERGPTTSYSVHWQTGREHDSWYSTAVARLAPLTNRPIV